MAESARVGLMIPNLFMRIPVEAAVRARGAQVLALADVASATSSGCSLVIADLDAFGSDPAAAVQALVASGAAVLAFGPHVEGVRLAAARAAGAVVLPRSAFLEQLRELLDTALPPGEGG